MSVEYGESPDNNMKNTMVATEKFVLLTDPGTYFVEYLIRELVLSDSVSKAMVFDDREQAQMFRKNAAC